MSGVHRKERGESRGIYVAIADDLDFLLLHRHAKLIWYTLKMKLGASGIGVLYMGELVEITGIPADDIEAAMTELQVTQWLVRERHVLWLRNALRFDPYLSLTNIKHVQGIVSHLSGLPRLKIVADFCAYYGLDMAWLDKGVPTGFELLEPVPLFRKPSDSHAKQEVGSRKEDLGSRNQEETPPAGPAETRPPKVKKSRKVVTYTPEFDDVWAIHPRGPKAKAQEEYTAAVPDRVAHEQLCACLERYVSTELNERFRGHDLFRWIRDDRWDEWATRRPFLAKDNASTRLRDKAEETAERLRQMGVAS